LYIALAVSTIPVYGQCLNYSTFFGKLQHDEIRGVCNDPQNNIYVIGNTYNTNLPVTSGAFQNASKGSYEAFLAKFDSCGSLIWCTYFGTAGFDSGEKITYSNDNTIVFCGYTDGANLDTTSGCFQTYNKGSYDCFLSKFSLSGNPIWITYFGAAQGDFAYDVKTDSLNNIIIGGTSTSNVLYTTTNSFQQFQSGATDAFIARFNSAGQLKFSTFFGGTNAEDIHALAIDKNCNIIGVGGSFSFNLNTSVGCYQAVSNGGMEIYVVKLDSAGQRIFSTYIGDVGTDDAYGVCTDNANHIYISGHTNSNNFYTSPGAFQSVKSGLNDCYCLSLSPAGAMQWSTFLGGSSNEFLTRMHINKNKELVILLSSQSTNFPMLGVGNTTVNTGPADAVIIKLISNGSPFWSTYLGGSSNETPYDLVSFTKNKIAVVGSTSSADFPLSGTVYQNTFNGTEDAFISCINSGSSIISGIKSDENKYCHYNMFYDPSQTQIVTRNDCYKKSTYEIRDVFGKLLVKSELRGSNINVSEFADGVYFVVIENNSENSQERFKFVKQ